MMAAILSRNQPKVNGSNRINTPMSTSATSPLLYAAETWEKVYEAFDQINFTAYDYDAVKQSLIDYLKLNYPENFNDYIESSQLIAIIETFAYVAELLAYRVDLSVHENLISSAQRKQSILRLAKLVSYTASRNLPLRGLVKVNSVSISEDVRDSQGNSLANRFVVWNDPNNPLWQEQFITVMNRVLTQAFGNPFKSFQVDDTVFQQYELQNLLETESSGSSFRNGVLKFKLSLNGQDTTFELVPADLDASGVYERAPNPNAYFTLLYGNDGYGDASDTTGFMLYVKQGELLKLTYLFDQSLPNRVVNVDVANVNDVDVWVQQVDEQGVITERWEEVPNVGGVNLVFNTVESHAKYEVETLEDDKIRVIFGDGDFADIPTGIFNIWVRQSIAGNSTVAKSDIADRSVTFTYVSKLGKQESCTLTYSLTAALQNASPSEDIEHIRTAAPSVYYTQNRMVNGQDYNSYFLKDPSILRLRSINRTFAGQPKYIEWNDASGAYQNVKVFGNDLRLYYDISSSAAIEEVSARSLIDEVLEPALSLPGIYNLLVYAFSISGSPLSEAFIRPRTTFIESVDQTIAGVPILEKTEIQGALDRHWYGEPSETVLLDASLSDSSALPKSVYAVVNDDTDSRIYDATVKMVTKNYVDGLYSLVPTPNNISGIQEAVIRQKRFGIRFNPERQLESALRINPSATDPDAIPDSDNLSSTDVSQVLGVEETYTIEITNVETGTFSVYGSVSGFKPSGQVGEAYTDGVISFLVGFPPAADETLYVGDAFLVTITDVSDVLTPTIARANLTGRFELINEAQLPLSAETNSYDLDVLENSWVMIVERNDDESGNLAYWRVVTRDFRLVTESATTKFWYNPDLTIIDPDTRLPVHDAVRVLKSNLTVDGDQALGTDQVYNVIGPIYNTDGTVNSNALSVSPRAAQAIFSGDGGAQSSFTFLSFIGADDYVYFEVDAETGNLTPLPVTVYLEGLTYTDGVSGNYVRKSGRADLDFLWQHFTPNDHLIDPSVSNIIDVYVLTRGYYSSVQNYIRGLEPVEPTPPTSLELRNTYRTLIESKMISDTVVMHSGKLKLLFGSQAIPELRAVFKIVRSPNAKLTGDQIRSKALDLVNQYFSIDNWDFGQSFYATELCAVIHKELATEISSVVLVPEFPTNYFGDLFYLQSAPDEIFTSCAKLEDVEIIENIDRLTLKQRPPTEIVTIVEVPTND